MSAKDTLDQAEIAFFSELQKFLRRGKTTLPRRVSRICAVDAAYGGDRVAAVASVFKDGQFLERSCYTGCCTLPYVSGLFFLREGPFVVEAVRRLRVLPQLICFDAHGAAHPRSAGLATVSGVVLGVPSVGMAKSLLVGKVVSGRGDLTRIVYDGKTVGFVTKTGGVTRYWSAGYSVSLGELRSVIRGYAPICLQAMAESDREARRHIRLG